MTEMTDSARPTGGVPVMASAAGEPIIGTLYVYDHDFAPVMSGQWKSRACSVCAHDVMNHWNVGVATASQIGGRPEDYLTVLEQDHHD